MHFLNHIYHFFIKVSFSSPKAFISVSLFFSTSVYGALSPTDSHPPITRAVFPSVDLSNHKVGINHFPEFDGIDKAHTIDPLDFENLNQQEKETLLSELRVTHILLKRENGGYCLADPLNNPDLVPDFVKAADKDSLMDIPPPISPCSQDEMLLIMETAKLSVLEPLKVAGFPILFTYATMAAITFGCGFEFFSAEDITSEESKEHLSFNADDNSHVRSISEVSADADEASKRFIRNYPVGEIVDGAHTAFKDIAGAFTCRDVIYLAK